MSSTSTIIHRILANLLHSFCERIARQRSRCSHLERGTGSEVGVGRALHGLLEHQPEGPVRPVREEVHVVGGHQPTRPGVQQLDGRAVLGRPVDGPVEAEAHHEDAAVNYEPKEKWGKVWKLSCRAS